VLYKKLTENEITFPQSRQLNEDCDDFPFVIVGDEGFGLGYFLLQPYGGSFLPVNKRVFNYRLSRARRYIECTFGILANKWRIFHRPLNVSLERPEDIIKTCCALHNSVCN
jgi:hypothetical protein